MNANTMNLQALANTARECAGRVNKMTLTAMTAHWNLCVDQSCLDETYKIVGVPGRKAHLARILNAYADDIEAVIAYAERTKDMTAEEQIAESNGIIRQAAFDALDLFAQWNEIDAAHAEALEENRRFDWLRARFGVFHVSLDAIKQQIVEEAHEEALRMNFTTLRGDELVEGMQLHRRDGSLGTIKRLRYPKDNTVEILEGGKWREFYRHNTFEVLH